MTEPDATATDADESGRRKMPLGGLWLTITLVMAVLSPLTWYVGIGLALVLLAAAAFFASRGFDVRGVVIGGVLALVISVGVTVAWNAFVATESEVTGKDKVQQRRSERAFDRAFERAEGVPGERAGKKRRKIRPDDAKPTALDGKPVADGGN